VREIVGMDEVRIRLTDQLLRFPTEDVAKRRVDEHEIPVHVDDGHQVRRTPKKLFETEVIHVARTHSSLR
jgi:hypothetical protein